MKLVILGATGSAGGSVLKVCLATRAVEAINAIVRRPLSVTHPKLRQMTHSNFEDYTDVSDAFAGVDACLYCLGKSVRQTSGEAEYRTLTHDYALAAARALRGQSPAAVFHFISGAGSSLDSRFMWARVKGETERDLLGQFTAVCWRPASIDGEPSASEPPGYKLFRPLARVLLQPFPTLYVKGEDIGLAMLQATADGIRGRIIENAEIRKIARLARARFSS